MNKKLSLILCIVAIVLLTALTLFLMWFLKTDGKYCLDNPFIYGAYKMKGNVSCYCTQFQEDNSPEAKVLGKCPNQFFFNATTMIGENDCTGIIGLH